MNLSLNRIACFFIGHKWRYYCRNIICQDDPVITIGFRECRRCARSKIDFIYGNGPNQNEGVKNE